MELLILCLISFMVSVTYGAEISVNSRNLGTIKGITETVTYAGRTSNISKFLGIPYAEPPIGDLRFSRPVKKPRFSEPFSALEYGPSCPQNSPTVNNQSEDCLSLNVFTPDVTVNAGARFPVMIFIHGGGFVVGSSAQYNGERLTAFGQVVLVTINYRLGPLGFLDVMDDTLIHPNNGLMDQHMAIKWVHDNIESFGGDRSKVTIFGESAGSASVIFQTLYPPNDGLFHRVIAQSGTATDVWAISRDPKQMARNLAIEMKCPVTSILEMVRCFKQYNDTQKMVVAASVDATAMWVPSYDKEFAVKSHIDELRHPTGNISLPLFEKVDLLMGTNGFEGHYVLTTDPQSLSIFRNDSYGIEMIKAINKNFMSTMLRLYWGDTITEMLMDEVMFFYSNFQNPQNRDGHITQLVNFLTDLYFLTETQSSIMRHAHMNTLSKTYQYEFDEVYSLAPQDSWVTGATHGSELAYIFGFPDGLSDFYGGYNDSMTRPLWPFSTTVMSYWTNFAKNGNPNDAGLKNWSEYNVMDAEYLYIKSDQINTRHHLHARRVHFWNKRIPMLIKNQRPLPNVVECMPTSSASFTVINLPTFIILISLYLYLC